MDTRRISGSRDSFRPVAELGTDTVPVDLIELARVRPIATMRGSTGLAAAGSAFLLIGALAAIMVLAIATSVGWSILRGY